MSTAAPSTSANVSGPRRRRIGPGWARSIARHALLAAISIAFALPLIWMAATSLKPEVQAAAGGMSLLPDPPSKTVEYAAANYKAVLADPTVNFPLYMRNTILVATLSMAGMVFSSAVVAYGLSRLKWRGRGPVLALVLGTMMIPFPVIMLPQYLIFKELGWIGSLKPLWIPAWTGGAFSVFLLRQFFLTIPRELDEAAAVDGCSAWGTFWRVILPVSKPALAVVALLHFVYTWNDFLGPLIFVNHRDQFTLALGLQLYQSQAGNIEWSLLMAASTMVVAPVVIVFLAAQRFFVEGVSSQGLKE
ncbi:MAG: sugar ABC transporter permease [Phycisphaerae bacterium]|nr:L-arabinose transport system permease protein AraQ [Phycisphaerales bacterium]MCK6475682.1 carbohydrate ABC transporter permease [Phycisphaerales bacterium]